MSQLQKGIIYVKVKEDIQPYQMVVYNHDGTASPFKPSKYYAKEAIRRKEVKIRPEQKFRKKITIWKSRSKRRHKMSNHFSNVA